MIIACPSCATKFDVGSVAFPPAGRKVKCARCAHVWIHRIAADPASVQPETAVAPLAAPATAAASSSHTPDPAPPAAVAREDAPPEMIWAGSELPRRRAGRGTLLSVGVAAFALVLAGAVIFRDAVVRMVPAAAPIYAAVGLPVDQTGLDITIKAEEMRSVEAGATTLVVTGVVANVTGEAKPVPLIRATLLAEDKTELHSWTFNAGVETLGPGESHAFRQELAQPPANTFQVFAHFMVP